MSMLLLSAPGSSQTTGSVRTFDLRTIFRDGTAPDYAITDALMRQITIGMKVLVFDRDRSQQMEGTVRGYKATTKAANGMQRYDIDIDDRRLVPYSDPPKVNLCGVGVG